MTELLSGRVGESRSECTLAIGLSLFLVGCAMSPAAKEAKADLRLERTAHVLSKRTDADSLAAAGLLSFSKNRDNAPALMARATAAEPGRADLVLLQAEVCGGVTPCDPEPIEQRLRELDPSNGAGWLATLARANASKDDRATDSALAAIGHSDHVDIYWTTLIAHLSRAIEQTKMLSPGEAEVLVIGFLSARAISPYGAAPTCKGERLQRAEIVESCRGVAKAFERGDTYLAEMTGISIVKRVWTEDSPEWKAAVEARRVYDYRSKFFGKLGVRSIMHPEKFLALCAENRREQDVLRAQLIEAGENPNPPPE
jgi:hypothetical protein